MNGSHCQLLEGGGVALSGADHEVVQDPILPHHFRHRWRAFRSMPATDPAVWADATLATPMASAQIVYCLTRDHDLANGLARALDAAISFYYNDAARLHQAIVLRRPDVVVIDTSAIRREYGDAGLGPVVGFVKERAPEAKVAVRPSLGSHWLVGAEAGEGVEMLPAEVGECIAAVAAWWVPA